MNLFDRLNKRPASTEAATEATTSLLEILDKERPLPPPIDERDTPIERLQKFLRRWRRPVVTLRDLYTHGPHCDRDKQTVLDLAQTLVQQGVLIPIVARRRDVMKWKIVPKGQRPAALTTHPPARPTAADRSQNCSLR
jgi:hypothetical protein